MIGKRFGQLIVIAETKTPSGQRNSYWTCKCDCGVVKDFNADKLRRKTNPTRACGHNHSKDLAGLRVGKLLVVSEAGRDNDRRYTWNCMCDCGNTVVVRSNNLRTGNSKSCGCEQLSESIREASKRASWKWSGKNHYRYNQNLTDEERSGERGCGSVLWRRSVLKRDNFTCQLCGKRGGRLNVHHLYSWAEHKGLRLDLANGVTLCENHHSEFHRYNGGLHKPSTAEGFEQFKLERRRADVAVAKRSD